MRITAQFVFFFSENDVFSQWYPSPFTVKGRHFPTAEHYRMYCKACLFGDERSADLILQASTPREAKAIGRKVANFNAEVWDNKATSYVRQASLAKFRQNKVIRT
ncbi:NADAR family protein, partial [Vibrio anguillarum]|uniref:NADAR family protein n=1 Tax=Vibrio anguillarum TaxID=55601 RepID=UPI00188A62DA